MANEAVVQAEPGMVESSHIDSHAMRTISRPITISEGFQATTLSTMVSQSLPIPGAGSSGAESPSSNSMSSTPSMEGSSSQSEYFSYDPTDSRKVSLKIASPQLQRGWKPSLDAEYEILQSLRVGERFDEQVAVFEGILSKKRRRRGTGFQKRFCRVDQGYLLFAKNKMDMERGMVLGKLDIGLSVVVLNAKKRGIEIDGTEAVHHFRVATEVAFMKWAQVLRDHRLYRQAMMAHLAFPDLDLINVDPLKDATLTPQQSAAARKFGLDVSKAQLDTILKKLDKASAMVEQLEATSVEPNSERDLQNNSVEGSRRTTIKRFFSRRKKTDVAPPRKDDTSSNTSTKGLNKRPISESLHLQIPIATCASASQLYDANTASPHAGTTTFSLPPSSPNHTSMLRKDGSRGSQSSLNNTLDSLPIVNNGSSGNNHLTSNRPDAGGHVIPRNDSGSHVSTRSDAETVLLARELLSTFRVIGNDFRQLYTRFYTALSEEGSLPRSNGTLQSRIVHTLSSDSGGTIGSCETFFTAISHFSGATLQPNASVGHMSDTSSDRGESRDEGGSTTDSESFDGLDEEMRLAPMNLQTGRRTTLPCPRPAADGSLLKMIGGFIGKDLTRLALPVKINEPLSMLQRLCEELEYCELLDRAAESSDPVERMTLVATFAISGFASSYYRAGTKPFNPLLGETYECVREDKGFRYVGEQVSHHPPVSVCFAESLSDKYCYWQDFRPKTRFWGRSIEITNHGEVHVTINKSEHYRWNKPSSRLGVAALMSQKGNIEIYGTTKITCSNDYYATLTFGKSGKGDGTAVQVEGSVHGPDRAPLTALFGSWNECVYWNDTGKTGTRVMWRAGAMPADHEKYYGFTRFAIELNELNDDLVDALPITDCRFRPDQRLLECGNIVAAEIEKKRVEQAQRERCSKYTKDHYPYEPKWFRRLEQAGNDTTDIYEFNYRYWVLREDPGFRNAQLDVLW